MLDMQPKTAEELSQMIMDRIRDLPGCEAILDVAIEGGGADWRCQPVAPKAGEPVSSNARSRIDGIVSELKRRFSLKA
jgi:hypothetical protein